LLPKYLIVVAYVEELDDIFEDLIYVGYVLEKRRICENCLELENLAGKINLVL
jgi:hypothetical protein